MRLADQTMCKRMLDIGNFMFYLSLGHLAVYDSNLKSNAFETTQGKSSIA